MPKISVIVPVYNVEAYLKRCIDSILNQSLYDLELILVDDGSPDKCGEICEEYVQKDSRVVVIHQENGGLSAARNTGIGYVMSRFESQWITFVDSDDWVHPRMLEMLLDCAMTHQVKVSICGYVETKGETPGVEMDKSHAVVWNPENYYVAQTVNATIACGKLYHRTCFEYIRYPLGRVHEDEFTTYRILFSLDKIGVISIPLYFYFQNCIGITRSSWNTKRLDCIDAMKEQLLYFEENGFSKALETTAVDYVYIICHQKKCIIASALPLEKKKELLQRLNGELRKSLYKYWRFYCYRRNIDIFCVLLPALKHVFGMAHKIRLIFRRGNLEE